jgi:hypothetical protein
MDNNPAFGSVAEFGMDKLPVIGQGPAPGAESLPAVVVAIAPGKVYFPESGRVDSGMGSHLAAVEEAGSDKEDTPVYSGTVAPASDSFPVKGKRVVRVYSNSPGENSSVAAG